MRRTRKKRQQGTTVMARAPRERPAVEEPRPGVVAAAARALPGRYGRALAVVTAFGVVLVVLRLAFAKAPATPVPEPARAAAPRWGRLEKRSQVLELPPGSVGPEQCDRVQSPWRLPGYTFASLRVLLERAGVDATQRARIEAAARCDGAGCVVRPDLALVAGLGAGPRAALYTTLATLPGNEVQATAFRRALADEPWSARPGLTPALRGLFERLAYRDGDALRFADLPVLCDRVATDGERRRALEVLKGRPVMSARLVVDATSDREALVRYWERGHGPGLAARLEQLARTPGGGSIELRELLPPFARARLDTFPAPGESEHDCYWTSLYFFTEGEAPALMPSSAEIGRITSEDYVPVGLDRLELGDVVVFYGPGDEGLHALNYVADDLVFTKNGASHLRPWQLARMDEVRALYPGTATMRAFRHRRFAR